MLKWLIRLGLAALATKLLAGASNADQKPRKRKAK
jgi:hypothetical protein